MLGTLTGHLTLSSWCPPPASVHTGPCPGSPERLFLAVPHLCPLPTVQSSGLASRLQTVGEAPQDGSRCEPIPPPSPASGSQEETSPSPKLAASRSAVCSWMCLCPVPRALGTRLSGSGTFKLLILFSYMLLRPWLKIFFYEIMTSFSLVCLADRP